MALEPDRLARRCPLQHQRQPDRLTQGKGLIGLEEQTRETHVPGDPCPPFQLHGNGDREARRLAPFAIPRGTLGVGTIQSLNLRTVSGNRAKDTWL
jgi:hypothetical protein